MAKSLYVIWAEKVLNSYLKDQTLIEPDDTFSSLKQMRAGCFVTLHKKNGNLRGCIGTFLPTEENIALEIRNNAIAAAIRDPRFNPVRYDELKDLILSVDILSEPELVKDYNESLDSGKLDPKKYGVILEDSTRWKRGLLLPDLEGVDSIEYQINIAMRKAGIFQGEKFRVYRFTSTRYF